MCICSMSRVWEPGPSAPRCEAVRDSIGGKSLTSDRSVECAGAHEDKSVMRAARLPEQGLFARRVSGAARDWGGVCDG